MKPIRIEITVILLSLGLSIACIAGAEARTHQDNPDSLLYSTSFESIDDTAGWHGVWAELFSTDTPPGGGNQSLRVSGGCIIPHAWLILPPLESDGWLTLRCWGKNLGIGGMVELSLVEQWPDGLTIQIEDHEWAGYSPFCTFFCPKGKALMLSLSSGGYVPSAMLVDLIEIRWMPIATDVPIPSEIPEGFGLFQNYPNPFNPSTTIPYILPHSGYVEIRVIDLLGRTIAILAGRSEQPGTHSINWHGTDLAGRPVAAGVYLCQLLVDGMPIQTRKLAVVR